jgi:hypothetical protein
MKKRIASRGAVVELELVIGGSRPRSCESLTIRDLPWKTRGEEKSARTRQRDRARLKRKRQVMHDMISNDDSDSVKKK